MAVIGCKPRLVFHVLVLLLCAGAAAAAANATNATCVASDAYPACHAPAVSSPRLRREVRALSKQDWDRVVDAMWIMKTVNMSEGQMRYGEAYRSYDYFVVMHAVISTDRRGDQSHYGAHFATVHAAFCLEFENALLAVDPAIEACPYWDNSMAEPSVFTEEYFGLDPGSDRMIKTGRFANWSIADSFDLADWAEYIKDNSTVTFRGNDAGQLRGNNNRLVTPVATRLGSGARWTAANLTQDIWWRCAVGLEGEIWEDWLWCMDGPAPGRGLVHSQAHQSIGGQSGSYIGDFADLATSPNDPLFMFHHSNMVRGKMWWMMVHSDQQCTYYGFPIEGGGSTWVQNKELLPWQPSIPVLPRETYYGTNLHDVPASTWGYTKESLGIMHPDAPAGPFTNADLVCWLMHHGRAPYVYDTQVDCLEDEDTCHPKQFIDAIEVDQLDFTVGARSSLPSVALWFLFATGWLLAIQPT